MNRRVVGWGLAGFLVWAVQVSAFAGLIFIDDFESPNILKSTPLQGEGGGVIGGDDINFWSIYIDPALTQGSVTPTNGFLQLACLNVTSGSGLVYLRSGAHSEFDYKSAALGEGLLMSVRGFSMDWADGQGVFRVGFSTGGSYYTSSNAAYLAVFASNGVVRFSAKELVNTDPLTQLITPIGQGRPTGLDLYIDSWGYTVTVHYNDDSLQQVAGFHGLDPETASDMRLMFQLLPGQPDHLALALVDGVAVTQIPEPTGLALMLTAVAGVLLARRKRGR